MNAVVLLSANDPQFAINKVPLPSISADEVLVNIKAIGVGVHDAYFLPQGISYPYVIGIEAAGIVHEIGSKVKGYSEGDRIAFVSSMQPKGGTWAEYAAVTASSLIIRIPDNLSFTEAATLPVAGNTILKAFGALNLPDGSTLFIAGASGAIGTLALQLARQRGLQVAASASEHNHEYMESLGADCTVDYRDPDWKKQVLAWCPGGVDAAIAIQPNTAHDSMDVVKDGGAVVPISGDQVPPIRGIRVQQLPYQADVTAELRQMFDQVAEGSLSVTVEKVYPFMDALEALQKVSQRRARGKVVVQVAE